MADPGHPPRECDVVVVGAGILGLASARELALRHDGIRIAVLEREGSIAAHQTGRTSGVIHAGIYYRPGSLKARLCVAGARELYEYCEERGIHAERSGKLIVATAADELDALAELERRGHENEVPGLRRIEAGDIREIEPHASGVAALHSPATGVVDFAEVAASFGRDLAGSGGSVATGCAVRALKPAGDAISVRHAFGTTRARAVVTCAGAWSDRLAVACGAPAEPRIVPFRGAYLRLRPERRDLVREQFTGVYARSANRTKCIDGDDAACQSLLHSASFSPLPRDIRASLVAEALRLGGARAYERLIETGGEDIRVRLAAAAGVPFDSLVSTWQARVHDTRVPSDAMRPSIAAASLGWIVLCLGLSMRSSRWR